MASSFGADFAFVEGGSQSEYNFSEFNTQASQSFGAGVSQDWGASDRSETGTSAAAVDTSGGDHPGAFVSEMSSCCILVGVLMFIVTHKQN
jgi:hypothetical protein